MIRSRQIALLGVPSYNRDVPGKPRSRDRTHFLGRYLARLREMCYDARVTQ